MCMVIVFFDLGCLLNTQFLSFHNKFSHNWFKHTFKTASTHTNTVARPDPKKVLFAITRLCNNYELLSFIQELQKGGSSCELYQLSILQEEETAIGSLHINSVCSSKDARKRDV